MRYLVINVILLVSAMFLVAGCETMTSTNVEGYSTLEEKLGPDEVARKEVFDAVAAYTPVQIVFEQAVMNPQIPADLKLAIKQLDKQIIESINSYRAQVAIGANDVSARLSTVVLLLGRAQHLLLQIIEKDLTDLSMLLKLLEPVPAHGLLVLIPATVEI